MAEADLTVGAPPPPQVAEPQNPKAKAPPGTPAAGRLGTPQSREQAVAADPTAAELVVDEKMVRRVLRSGSGAANAVFGDDDVPDHWRFTTDELDELVPPLTRYINRTPRLMLAMQHGDELAMLQTIGGYGFRNFMAGRAAEEARREREREAEGAGTTADVRLGAPMQGDGDHGQDAVGNGQR